MDPSFQLPSHICATAGNKKRENASLVEEHGTFDKFLYTVRYAAYIAGASIDPCIYVVCTLFLGDAAHDIPSTTMTTRTRSPGNVQPYKWLLRAGYACVKQSCRYL